MIKVYQQLCTVYNIIRNVLICCHDHYCTAVVVYAARYNIISGTRNIIILYNNTASWLMVSRGSIYNSTALRCSCSLSDIASPPSASPSSSEGTFPKPLPFLYYCPPFFARVSVSIHKRVRVLYVYIYFCTVDELTSRLLAQFLRARRARFRLSRQDLYIYLCVCTVGE